jgi:putative ABC transport system ATP-binding protein
LNREIGSTLFVVTHDMDLASRCKVRIELKDGEIASIEGNPRADATKPLSVAGKGEKA